MTVDWMSLLIDIPAASYEMDNTGLFVASDRPGSLEKQCVDLE